MRVFIRSLVATTILVLIACSACSEPRAKEERLCTPGAYVFCRCENRNEGTKLCKEDGTSFAACAPCEGDSKNSLSGSTEESGGSGERSPMSGSHRDDEPPPPSTTTCKQDSDCNALGRICQSGDCVKGCRSTSQCETGFVCRSQQCEKEVASAECLIDEHCDLGTICLSEKCVLGCYSTYDCPIGQACAGGRCAPESGSSGSVECSSDGQCNPGDNGSGRICGAEGSCIPGCRKDYHCPGSKICVSGQCT
jgi:hypothetical protein